MITRDERCWRVLLQTWTSKLKETSKCKAIKRMETSLHSIWKLRPFSLEHIKPNTHRPESSVERCNLIINRILTIKYRTVHNTNFNWLIKDVPMNQSGVFSSTLCRCTINSGRNNTRDNFTATKCSQWLMTWKSSHVVFTPTDPRWHQTSAPIGIPYRGPWLCQSFQSRLRCYMKRRHEEPAECKQEVWTLN